MKWISTVIVSLSTLGLCLFLNGNLSSANYFPPLAKILFPKSGLWNNAEIRYLNETIESPYISHPIQISFDDRMVPHVKANSLDDALFAQGYLEARHRLFQMDLSSRSAAGRLSEIIGSKSLKADISSRKNGLAWAAQNSVDLWEQSDHLNYLEQYTHGVNSYIKDLKKKEYPFEFKLFDYHPEEWTLLKSALIQKSMARVLSYRSDDIALSNLKTVLADSTFNLLFPERNPCDIPIIPDEVVFDFECIYDVFDESLNIIDSFPYFHLEQSNPNAGSNNWAVNAIKSQSGRPILANDPHLNLTLPSIWYEIHIQTPEINARGVSIPGIPGIMIGFNESLAWGETNVGHDIKDYYLIKYADDTQERYLIDGTEKPITQRNEDIIVRNADTHKLTVNYTSWGPITHESKDHKKDLAMSWLAHYQWDSNDYLTFIDAMKAKTLDEYLDATKHFTTPAQNFLVATKDDDIAIRINGLMPAKLPGDGRFVKDGSKSSSGWETFVDRQQNPLVVNPTSGFVASANQWSTAEDYPYYYNSGGFENFRGRVLNRKLQEIDKADIKNMMDLQADQYNIKAEEMIPFLLESLENQRLDSLQLEAKKILTNWNFEYDSKSIAATLFENWYNQYKRLMYDEIYTLSSRMNIAIPNYHVTNELSNSQADNKIFDLISTSEVENAHDIARMAYSSITTDDRYLEAWGKYRPVRIPHIARIDGLGTDKMELGGNSDVLNAIQGGFAPSWRMIVALGDTPEAYGVFPGGQSGNPISKFFQNSVDIWSSGAYYDLKLDDEIEKPLFLIEIKPDTDE